MWALELLYGLHGGTVHGLGEEYRTWSVAIAEWRHALNSAPVGQWATRFR